MSKKLNHTITIESQFYSFVNESKWVGVPVFRLCWLINSHLGISELIVTEYKF